MNNQAEQTMPEHVADALNVVNEAANRERHAGNYEHANSLVRARVALAKFALSQTAGVTEGGLEAFTDYFVKNYPGPDTIIYDPKWHAPRIFRAAQRAIQAAAPAASGGECKTDADLPGMWERADLIGGMTDAEPQPPSAASVSERLLALADEIDRQARECPTVDWRPNAHENARNLRAIEQALTQQRGAVDWLAFAYELEAFKPRGELGALHGAGMAFAYKDVAKTIRAKLATTTPQPGAEALRELVKRWREDAEIADRNTEGNSYAICADELESLLARGGK